MARKKPKKLAFEPISDALKSASPTQELLASMPFELMRDLNAFVIEKKGDVVTIATSNPHESAFQNYIEHFFSDACKVVETTEEHITSVLDKFEHDFTTEVQDIAADNVLVNGNITKLVDRIIDHAISEGVSDVHIEPRRNDAVVRFRADGVLHTKHTLTTDTYQAVTARLKVMADLKIDEYRKPQDGRIELVKPANTSLRISTVPTLFGEKVVFRVLNEAVSRLTVEDLGFTKEQQEVLMRNVEKPFGMIVASGPTGSGKTTSLYALLRLLKRDGINISTLEDPIEGVLNDVNQIQINTTVGLTFASGLRALLRQDPDVIMVGEIRDSETAVMAANAAMTGHLVFSTMHTNDAPSAFVRFLEMDVGDFVVASTVNLVIAQRLARKVCDNCASEEPLDSVLLGKIEKRKDVLEALERGGVASLAQLKKKKFRKGKGCEKCYETGYVGRIGLFEMIEPNREVRELVLDHASAEEIKTAAQEIESYSEMIDDGVGKILSGKTTFDEVLHITRSSI